MKPSLFLPPRETDRWTIARQIGVEHAVTPLPRGADTDPWTYDTLLAMRNRFEDAGFEVAVIEDRPPMDDVMAGGPARDEQIETIKGLLRTMGRLDIPVWCPAWMAKHHWARTATALPDRGGSLITGFDQTDLQRAPALGTITEETLWENLASFLDEVVPVAEDAGVKLAWHPDDPPLSPFRGVGRILSSPENFARLLDLVDSPANGLTFCQGNFVAMGADIPTTVKRFSDRIHFVHFRDVEGTAEQFRETWHDDGPTDMVAAMRAYDEIGFDGPIRPDHVPTMAGEDNDQPGYEMKGRLFAIGYMKGLMERLERESDHVP